MCVCNIISLFGVRFVVVCFVQFEKHFFFSETNIYTIKLEKKEKYFWVNCCCFFLQYNAKLYNAIRLDTLQYIDEQIKRVYK